MKTSYLALAALFAFPAAAAASPEDGYRSTTAAYIPYRAAGMADWRAVNDEMGRLNGHMGHMADPAGHGGHGHDMGHDMGRPVAPSPPGADTAAGHQHHPTGGRP